MAHTCNRDNCPPDAVNGPKAKCFVCKKLCYLACFGITTSTSKLCVHNVSDGAKIDHFSPSSNVQFVCTECLSSPSLLSQPNQSLNDSLTTPKGRITINAIISEVNKLQEQFASYQSLNTDMKAKLDSIETKAVEIKESTTEIKANTDAVLNEVKSKPSKSNGNELILFGSSPLATRPFRPALNHGKTPASYSSMLRNAATPPTSKRRRDNEKPVKQPMPNVPPPKVGTKASTSRLVAVVAAKPQPKKQNEKPKFEKAVWVSRLPTTTTDDMIREHITELQTVSSNFEIHKLVKKDRDLSELSYISFKIAVNDADFAILNDPTVWPTGVLVREFVENKPVTFGEFLLKDLNAENARQTNDSIAMDVQTNNGTTSPTKQSDIVHVDS